MQVSKRGSFTKARHFYQALGYASALPHASAEAREDYPLTNGGQDCRDGQDYRRLPLATKFILYFFRDFSFTGLYNGGRRATPNVAAF